MWVINRRKKIRNCKKFTLLQTHKGEEWISLVFRIDLLFISIVTILMMIMIMMMIQGKTVSTRTTNIYIYSFVIYMYHKFIVGSITY